MKISPQVQVMTKGEIMELATEDGVLDTALVVKFGNHAFDTNFVRVKLEDMQELVQELIDDGDLVL